MTVPFVNEIYKILTQHMLTDATTTFRNAHLRGDKITLQRAIDGKKETFEILVRPVDADNVVHQNNDAEDDGC